MSKKKKKPKQLGVAPSKTKSLTDEQIKVHTENLAYSINKISADSMGLSVEEYLEWRKKTLAARKKYDDAHWVTPLTDGQVFTILYQKETKPYMYMGKPVSKENEFKIDRYKQFNKGWKEYKLKQAKTKNALESMQLPLEVQKAGEQYKKMMDSVNKTLEPLKRTTEKLKSFGNPFGSAFGNPFRGLGGIVNSDVVGGGLLSGLLGDGDERVIKKKDNGLDGYAKRNNLKNGVEIAEHYLKTFDSPSKKDYAVISYENIGALAETVDITPDEAFVALCHYIKRSRTKILKRLTEQRNQVKVEQLVNHYLSEKQRHQDKKLGALTMQKFYRSKYVKTFISELNLKLDYKRFNDKMKTWIKIYTSRAHKVN